jgi:anti-anti-sigma factor
MDIEYKVKMDDERGFITMHGDFDDEVAGEAFRKAFNRVFDSGRRTVILDLGKIDILNSYGIGKIMIAYRRLQAEGGLLMVTPLQGNSRELLELLMIDSLLPVFREEETESTSEESA